MDCPSCHVRLNRVGLERIENGKVIAEFECPKCHARISQAMPKNPINF